MRPQTSQKYGLPCRFRPLFIRHWYKMYKTPVRESLAVVNQEISRLLKTLPSLSPPQAAGLRGPQNSEAAEEIDTKHFRYTCQHKVLLWPFSPLPRPKRKR